MHTASVQLGRRENLGQFSLLVLDNAFVGAMVDLERSILPAIAGRSSIWPRERLAPHKEASIIEWAVASRPSGSMSRQLCLGSSSSASKP